MRRLAWVGVWLALAGAADAPVGMTGKPSGNLLVGGSGRVFILSPEGKTLWEHKAALVHDVWMLPSGNVLYADGAVTEVTPDHKVVFHYEAPDKRGGGAFACQRLANGNTFVGENSTGRVVEVDPQGNVVFKLELQPAKQGDHNNMRLARKLANGNYLVCQKGYKVVREFTPKGEVVQELKLGNIAFGALRTPQGTTYVSSLDHLAEYDAKGAKLWDFANTDLPGVKITNMCGFQVLPNGNMLVGCYASYDKQGAGTGLFEITRDKQLVWRFADPKAGGTTMPLQLLDANSKPLPGEALR